ncbi:MULTISPECIES: DUF2273 domain-containing protein [unclassified Allobranchiibius]|uniref:DUF2273 domain-containing protein n=1 Tax=unclassified Allobranchiibius TaxID=2649857 RepID=UPI001AA19C26|nr:MULTISPECIES: DUF2273 domain-containing protein [unclassified Allobranchiibius]MBO1755020.1 DUF2273 domain-containing protein [Allobranchiibius sp. CTAmp26]MBO1768335.1 DUF2273 domain-containing protein [Allobranchiibius sp. GilTou38]
MTRSALGLLAGLLMAIAIAIDGFTGFLLALVLGVIGYLVGAQVDGELDLAALVRGKRE